MSDGHWIHGCTSATGSRHRNRGEPCEDSGSAALLLVGPAPGWAVMTVADGAGSASRSAAGSAAAVRLSQFILIRMLVRFGPDLRRIERRSYFWLVRIRQEMVRLAGELGVTVSDLSATCIGAIVGPPGVLLLQVGDGAAVVQMRGAQPELIVPPLRGEYVGETGFVTGMHAYEHQRTRFVPGTVDWLALMTDGVADLAIDVAEGKPHAGFFAPLVNWARELAAGGRRDLSPALKEVLEGGDMDRGTDDDRTLALLVRAQ